MFNKAGAFGICVQQTYFIAWAK